MRLPWNKSKEEQLDHAHEASADSGDRLIAEATTLSSLLRRAQGCLNSRSTFSRQRPLVPVDSLEDDPDNSRTEFPDEEIAELAQTSRCAASSSRSAFLGGSLPGPL
jgi:hypothetical protein